MYLNSLDLTKYTPLGSAEYPAYTLFDSITQVIRHRISPEAAQLLAEPIFDDHSQQIDYMGAAEGEVRTFDSLADPERNALLDQLTVYSSQIRSLAERYLASNDPHAKRLGQNLLQTLYVPETANIYVVNAQPVLTGWGLKHRVGQDPFDISESQNLKIPPASPAPVLAPTAGLNLTPEPEPKPEPKPEPVAIPPAVPPQTESPVIAKEAQPDPRREATSIATGRKRSPWGFWLLALLVGLILLWLLGRWFSAPVPSASPSSLGTDSGSTSSDGERPLISENETHAPDTALVIPQVSIETGDLGFLQGEWVSITDLVSTRSHEPLTILYAFDHNGTGTTTIMRDPGGKCVAPVQAHFKPDHRLYIQDQADVRCADSVFFEKSNVVCEVAENGQAVCLGHQVNNQYSVTLKRRSGE